MTEAQIKHMVDRFLRWRLPANFSPDNGISFEPLGSKGTPHELRREPVGTNLLDATQATEMVRHMVGGMGDATAWLIEKHYADRLYYWCAGAPTIERGHHTRGTDLDGWSTSADTGVRFSRREDAMLILMHLLHGEGRVAEHMWCAAPKAA